MRQLLEAAREARILVVGDVMLDHYLWGSVARISPEAPVPVVEFQRESHVPGGAGNVARNLADLQVATELVGLMGDDHSALRLKKVLKHDQIGCHGLIQCRHRRTSVKTRIIAQRQQVVRVDRESRESVDDRTAVRLLGQIEQRIPRMDAVILCDYAKGVVSQELFDRTKALCRKHGVWLSLDPKPSNQLNAAGVSLLTPNRAEAFELAGMRDSGSRHEPLRAAEKILAEMQPVLLLVTLGNEGMLLCQRGREPLPIPTVAREVFDVSGAGDTVIASFTLAIAAGATPEEAAIFSNQAAGIVVGKVGTATVHAEELLRESM